MPRTSRKTLILVALALAPTGAAAQEPYGPLVPRGTLRLEASPFFTTYSSVFAYDPGGASGLEALGLGFTASSAGINVLPSLRGFQDAVGSAAQQGYTLRLGTMAAIVEKSAVRVPLSLDVGVFDWLTVGGTVPIVQNETEVAFDFASDSLGANAGFSPGVTDPFVVDGFLEDFVGAISSFEAVQAQACGLDMASTECLTLTTMLGNAQAFHGHLSAMYGAFLAPVSWSVAGLAMQQRLAEIASGFAGAGVAGVPIQVPLAGATLSRADLQRLITDPRFGNGASWPLETWRSLWVLGDVELRADARLVQVGGAEGGSVLVAGAGALVRIGTGTQDDPANFLDMGTGDGQRDVEVRGWLNGRWRSRLGLWLDVRYGIQMSGITVRRVFDPGFAMAPQSSQLTLIWDPGEYRRIELAPWFRIADQLTLVSGLRYFGKGVDSFTLGNVGEIDPATLPDPALLAQGTDISMRQLTAGVVYNRAGDRDRATSDKPLEFRILYRHTVSGSGRDVPKARSIEAGFRYFIGIWGR